MVRKRFILAAFCLCLVIAGGSLGFTHASVLSTDLSPHPSTSVSPTPSLAPNDPSPAGGLGDLRPGVERVYGAPTGLQGTMIAYSKDAPAVTYTQNRASALLVRFKGENGVSLDQARNQLQALLPPDRVLVGTSAAGTGRTADLYHSDLLAAKVGSLTTGGSPGEFVVVYQTNAVGEIESALLAVGGVPKSP